MTLLRFTPDLGRPIDRFGSNFTLARVHHDETLHVGCMYIPAGGLVGYHPAAGTQLFLVVSGQGWVRTGTAERVPVEAGTGVRWEAGDLHEAGSDTGMTVMVIEV